MLSMLRKFRLPSFTLPWQVPVLGWFAAGIVGVLGTGLAGNAALAAAGVLTALSARQVARQVSTHQSEHRRTDRQLGLVVDVTRAVYTSVDREPPHGLEDEREHLGEGAEVVRITPRAGGPRHSRPRSRRLGA